jgi:hypothetical protein
MKTPFAILAIALSLTASAYADSFSFSNGAPDGKMAMASRPSSLGKTEIEAADDFILASTTSLTSATFYGLLSPNVPLSSIFSVSTEFYRTFPNDSTVPADGLVPTRINSPSDVEFTDRNSNAGGGLTFSVTTLNSNFTALNSVLNGIHPFPNQTTGGEGSVTGIEVEIDVSFTTAVDLNADHYFFAPQVGVSNGNFFWLSSPRPNPSFAPDLQAWIRNGTLDPDWLRVGTDIVGGSPAPTFNGAFSLAGSTASTVPEPSTLVLLLTSSGMLLRRLRR